MCNHRTSNLVNFCTFSPQPCKNNEMYETRFQVPHMSQPLIYFWRGATAHAGRFNPFPPASLGKGQFRPDLFSELGGPGPSYTKFGEDVGP